MAPKKMTALHYTHLDAGARMEAEDGWLRPVEYGDVAGEVAAARERVGLADISTVGKLDVKGTEAAAFVAGALRFPDAADVSGVNTGIGLLHSGAGTVAVRGCRLTAEHLLLLTPPERAASVWDALTEAAVGHGRAYLTDVTSVLAGLALIGPCAPDVLRKLTALDVSPAALPDGACAETALAGVHALLLHADRAYGQAEGPPLPAYELYVTRDVAEFVWDALMDAGREYGIAPVGLQAYRSL
jgi:sarcosine oxidase subunit alpha